MYRREGVAAYIGEEVRVTERDGSNTDGFLIDVTDKMLIVEKRIVRGHTIVPIRIVRKVD